jgi:hypothetical protein
MPQKHTIMLKIAYINTYISGISQIKQDSLLGPMHIRVAPYQNGLDFERKKIQGYIRLNIQQKWSNLLKSTRSHLSLALSNAS